MNHQKTTERQRRMKGMWIFGFGAGLSLSTATACTDEGYCEEDYCEKRGYGDGYAPYLCKPTTGFLKVDCFFSETEAFFWCQGMGGTARAPVCDETYGGTGETSGGDETSGDPNTSGWFPSEHVTFNSHLDQYEVDATFVEELKADTSLLALDHSYVVAVKSGHYQLHNVSEGDLAYAMGLRSGDVLVNLNGFELDSIDSLLDAYDDLEYMREFFLTVEHGVDPTQFTYVIVDDG